MPRKQRSKLRSNPFVRGCIYHGPWFQESLNWWKLKYLSRKTSIPSSRFTGSPKNNIHIKSYSFLIYRQKTSIIPTFTLRKKRSHHIYPQLACHWMKHLVYYPNKAASFSLPRSLRHRWVLPSTWRLTSDSPAESRTLLPRRMHQSLPLLSSYDRVILSQLRQSRPNHTRTAPRTLKTY